MKNSSIKTLFLITALVIMGTAITGCQKDAPMPEGVTVENELITVSYEENPTTGYTWSWTIDNEDIVAFKSDTFTSPDSETEFVGAGGIHTFVFEAQGPGEAVITMTYRRDWEGGDSNDPINLKVTVDKDRKATVE